MSDSANEGRIDYIEIPVTDVGEAKRFYSEVFGWSFEDFGPDYTSFDDGRLTGGFYTAEEVRAGGALVVIYSANLEATREKVTSAGGVIVSQREFPGGRRFHFVDPSGNELAVWTDK